jgi:solute:Na+ symporter, SSS family
VNRAVPFSPPYHPLVIIAAVALIGGAAFFPARNGDAHPVREYFLAGGRVHWAFTGIALFVTMLWGVLLLVGQSAPTMIAANLLIAGTFSVAGLVLLGFVYGPKLRAQGTLTLASYMNLRYSPAVSLVVALAWVGFTLFVRIPFTIFLGTRLIHSTLAWDIVPAGLLLVVLPGLLVVLRGYMVVLISHTTAALFAFVTVVVGMVQGFPQLSVGISGGFMPDALPTSAVIFGAAVLALWSSCADQLSAQHAFAVREGSGIRAGSILGGICLALIVVASFASTDQGAAARSSDGTLMTALVGGTSFLLAIAALSSQFLGVAALIGVDVFRAIRQGNDEGSVVLVSRAVTTFAVIVGILAGTTVGLVEIEQSVLFVRAVAVAAPPLAAVVAVGGIWQRANGRGALFALLIGWSAGVLQSVLIADSVPNLLFSSVVTFVLSASVLAIVSLMASPVRAVQGNDPPISKHLESRAI